MAQAETPLELNETRLVMNDIHSPNDQEVENFKEPTYQVLAKWFFRLLFKSHLWERKQSRTLILFRVLAVLLAVVCQFIDLAVFRHSYEIPKSELIFCYELTSVVYEIVAMIYASGAAVFGTTADAVALVSVVVANCIFVYTNCPDISQQRVLPVLWIIRALYLMVCVELMHRNFTKLINYGDACRESARTMLLQAVLFSFMILLLQAPGLKTVYDNVIIKPAKCAYRINTCGITEFYYPKFAPGDSCEESFVEYIRTREEVRVVRDFIYLHIAYYSMFNKSLLSLTGTKDRLLNVLHVIILCGFACLVISLVWSNVAPFYFVGWPKRYFFDMVEAILFTLILIMLLYKYKATGEETGPMEKHPSILFGIV